MIEVETTKFGLIEIEEEKVIEFEQKILGFEDYTEFTIIDNLEDDSFYWLQSLEEPGLSFIMINPLDFIEDYQFSLTDKFQHKLDLQEESDIIIYTLVVIDKKNEYIATNLKAPIIINVQNRKAGQIILNEDYPTRHYLFNKTEREMEVSG